MLDVWYSLAPPALPQCMDTEEIKRRDRFVFEKDRLAHALAHNFKRHTLSLYAPEVAPEAWRFTLGKWGKPSIVQAVPFKCNLSHSGAGVALAVAGSEVGADIEQHKPMSDMAGIASTVFHPDELEWLWRQTNTEHAFFRLWTVKEALLKAAGTGFSLPSADFACQGLEDGDEVQATVAGIRWHCASHRLDGHTLSVAVPLATHLDDLRLFSVSGERQPSPLPHDGFPPGNPILPHAKAEPYP